MRRIGLLSGTKAFIFPGQGSQSVGMAKDLADQFPSARDLLDEVDDALDQNLSALMFAGPQAELTLTANAQPALMAASLAAIRVLEAEAGLDISRDAHFVAGHSLGEYSALAAAGSLSVAETAKLLRLRGKAMQDAAPPGAGAMAALLGIEVEAARAIARQAAHEIGGGAVCAVANDNGGGQTVVSGSTAAVDRAIEIAKLKGARRAILLPVSAPFHCSLMQPAAEIMAAALARTEIRPPSAPLVANVLAAQVNDPEDIRQLLVAQVTGVVRWRESLLFMGERGVSVFIECGAGKVLSGLVKRVCPEARSLAIGAPADVPAYQAHA